MARQKRAIVVILQYGIKSFLKIHHHYFNCDICCVWHRQVQGETRQMEN